MDDVSMLLCSMIIGRCRGFWLCDEKSGNWAGWPCLGSLHEASRARKM